MRSTRFILVSNPHAMALWYLGCRGQSHSQFTLRCLSLAKGWGCNLSLSPPLLPPEKSMTRISSESPSLSYHNGLRWAALDGKMSVEQFTRPKRGTGGCSPHDVLKGTRSLLVFSRTLAKVFRIPTYFVVPTLGF